MTAVRAVKIETATMFFSAIKCFFSQQSLCGLTTLLFLAEINDCECYSADIGDAAYLEAKTKEKLYIVAGP